MKKIALLLLTGVALTSCGVKDAMNDVAETAGNAAGAVVETAGDVAENAADAVVDAGEVVVDATTEAAETVAETTGDVVEGAAEVIEDTAETIVETTEEAAEATTDTVEEAAEAITESGTYTVYSSESLAPADTKTALFFHASWCPSCRGLDSELTNASIPAGATILKADYDNEVDLKEKYGITQQHTVIILDAEGNESNRLTGGNADEIITALQ